MRANDRKTSIWQDKTELIRKVKTTFNGYGAQTPIGPDEDFIRLPEEKDPYAKLARAVLLRAVDDMLLPDTPANRSIIDDARDFLLGENNMHRAFWRSVARLD
jgi:hypothetical protein